MRTLFKDRHTRLSAYDLQLVDRRRTINIARDQKGLFALFFQKHGELAAQRRLARALQTAHHDDRRRFVRNFQFRVRRTHQRDQLFVDDLDHLLGRVQALENFLPDRLFRYVRNEFFRHKYIDVRFQKRNAHFTHRPLDLQFRELSVLGQLGKYMVQSVRQR